MEEKEREIMFKGTDSGAVYGSECLTWGTVKMLLPSGRSAEVSALHGIQR